LLSRPSQAAGLFACVVVGILLLEERHPARWNCKMCDALGACNSNAGK